MCLRAPQAEQLFASDDNLLADFRPAVALTLIMLWAVLEPSARLLVQLLAANRTVFGAGDALRRISAMVDARSYLCVQDAVEAQMGPLLRDNKPRWLGDVKMTRFTMGSKVRSTMTCAHLARDGVRPGFSVPSALVQPVSLF